jgi:hypothetical protein
VYGVFQAAVVDDAVSSDEPCAKRVCTAPAPPPPPSTTCNEDESATVASAGDVPVNCKATTQKEASSSSGDISSTVAEQ